MDPVQTKIALVFAIMFAAVILGVVIVSQGTDFQMAPEETSMDTGHDGTMTNGDTTTENATVAESGWKDVSLKDLRTGSTFKVSDFNDKPILMESFAVWCPTCTAQQNVFKQVKTVNGHEVVHISLDTDPNESEQKVLDHLTRNGFDWLYAIPPASLTQELIDEFGLPIVNATSAPVVIICPGTPQTATLIQKSGLKQAPTLLEELQTTCGL
ncbi:MAG: redoxin family protein [Candidatus Diapherotrites archaeon]|nr:redoxin family protein [Candidatus Diapherotrites archaeon]